MSMLSSICEWRRIARSSIYSGCSPPVSINTDFKSSPLSAEEYNIDHWLAVGLLVCLLICFKSDQCMKTALCHEGHMWIPYISKGTYTIELQTTHIWPVDGVTLHWQSFLSPALPISPPQFEKQKSNPPVSTSVPFYGYSGFSIIRIWLVSTKLICQSIQKGQVLKI